MMIPENSLQMALNRESLALQAYNMARETRRMIQASYEENIKRAPVRTIAQAKRIARAQTAARVADKVRSLRGEPVPPHIQAFNEVLAEVQRDHPLKSLEDAKQITRFRLKLRSHRKIIETL